MWSVDAMRHGNVVSGCYETWECGQWILRDMGMWSVDTMRHGNVVSVSVCVCVDV